MEYDAYGRPLQDLGYLDAQNNSTPVSSRQQHAAEQRNAYSSSHQRTSSTAQQEGKMSVPERSETAASHDVSPELIAAITEKVKRELMEHLKQTGTPVDDQPKAPPLHRIPSNRSSSTSSPPPSARKVYTPPSPVQSSKQTFSMPQPSEGATSQPGSPSGVRFSDRPLPTRPGGAPRNYSSLELSTIDQKWGRLFDNEGNPTQRLGQFLRGLANHIVEEFSPKKSIVVLPTKMAAFYAQNSLDKEAQPYVSIFRAQSNEQISKLYQDLGCEHHLVQETATTAPVVPALTPLGFSHWMSLHILAYPNDESKRLEQAVLAMPINADGEMVDGKPERLPKQISRHLLPEREDKTSKKLIESAILNFFEHLGSSTRRRGSITASPSLSRHSSTSTVPSSTNRQRPVEIHQSKGSPPSSKTQPIERERNPYSGAPSASDTSSNEDTGVKLERDRKPYTAQPGSGQVYNEGTSFNSGPRVGRSNSTSQSREPPRIPSETRHGRTYSSTNQSYVPPLRSGRRASSPPFKSYSNSTPDDIGGFRNGPPPSHSASFSTASQFTPSSYGNPSAIPPPPPIDIRDSRDKRARDERQRRATDVEFNSPRDAERWDRLQDRIHDSSRPERGYDRHSIAVDPREVRGAAYEDWYRDSQGRGPGYEPSENRY